MRLHVFAVIGVVCLSFSAAKADPIAEMASSIVDLRAVLDVRLAAARSDPQGVGNAARAVSRAAGQDLACREHDEAEIEATAAQAREIILLAFLVSREASEFSPNYFENQVRYGIQEGCFQGERDTMSEAQASVSREIGLIFELQQEIEDREGRLLELLRE